MTAPLVIVDEGAGHLEEGAGNLLPAEEPKGLGVRVPGLVPGVGRDVQEVPRLDL